MPVRTRRLRGVIALSAVVASGLAAAGPVYAAASESTITATGTAFVRPVPTDRTSNDSIAAAVREAKKKLLPMAVTAARARAVQIGQATGLSVGAVQSVTDSPFSPFFGGPFGPFGEEGTFGPGKFCGTVGRFKFTRRDGRIVGRRRVGSRRVCRVPSRISTALTVTYAASPAPPAPAG